MDITELLAECKTGNIFIGGDFNAHHSTLGSIRNNRNGHHIIETLNNIPEATLLNNQEPTHIAGRVLDLSFLSRNISNNAKWDLHPHLASDHIATCTEIKIPQLANHTMAPRWDTKRANWPLFQQELQKLLSNPPESQTLEEREARLVDAIHQAADAAIPKTKPSPKHYKDAWYYNSAVKEYNHRINQARKLNRRHQTSTARKLLKAAIQIAKDASKKIQIEKWLKWCASMGHGNNIGETWRKIKIAAGKAPTKQPVHPDPTGEANRLIDTFAARSSSNQLLVEVRRTQDQLEERRIIATNRASQEAAETDTPFTMRELKASFKNRKDTSAGADKITYSMIKEAGQTAQKEVLNLINQSYEEGKLPPAWKTATIVPIPKLRDPGAFRPISLLSCLGKTAEKMVLNRLQWATGDLHQNVYAYTKNRGTKDCIMELTSTISNKKAIVTFMDLEKAFEIASASAILESLARRGVKRKLVKWCKDFLEERRAHVRFQGKTSNTQTFDKGTPQGSILSPFLFNLLVENLATLPLGSGTKVLVYADDIAIITSGANYKAKAKNAVASVANKCQELGLKINGNKTHSIHFGSQLQLPPISIYGTPVEWTTCHQYLGIWLDYQLNYNRHIAATKEKTSARLRVMRAITGLRGGAEPPVLRSYYMQGIRSIIEYGASCLATTSKTGLATMDRIQNQALRIITGAPRWTNICTLQAETNIPPIKTRLYSTTIGHLIKFLRRQNKTLCHKIKQALLQDKNLFRKKTWAATTSNIIQYMKSQHTFLNFKEDPPAEDYRFPPSWQEPPLKITVHTLTEAKKKLHPAALAAEAREALSLAPALHPNTYYTDGSVNQSTGTASAAFVNKNTTAIYRLPDGSSTLQTELLAIQKALQHAEQEQQGAVINRKQGINYARSQSKREHWVQKCKMVHHHQEKHHTTPTTPK